MNNGTPDDREPADGGEAATQAAMDALLRVRLGRATPPAWESVAARLHARSRTLDMPRRTWPRMGVAALLVVAVGLFLRFQRQDEIPVAALSPAPHAAPRSLLGHVRWAQGDAMINDTAAWAGTRLYAGDQVDTEGPDGILEIQTAGHDATIWLAGDAQARLWPSRPSGLRVELLSGVLEADVREPGAHIAVKTALGTVRNQGTQFRVEYRPATVESPVHDPADSERLRVWVQRGRVAVTSPGGDWSVQAGERLILSPEGRQEPSPDEDARTAQVLGVLPAFEAPPGWERQLRNAEPVVRATRRVLSPRGERWVVDVEAFGQTHRVRAGADGRVEEILPRDGETRTHRRSPIHRKEEQR